MNIGRAAFLEDHAKVDLAIRQAIASRASARVLRDLRRRRAEIERILDADADPTSEVRIRNLDGVPVYVTPGDVRGPVVKTAPTIAPDGQFTAEQRWTPLGKRYPALY